ncbi:MAG: DNA-directed RNA polymerase subunit beta [Chloroflexi bacterium]|nr:DNA-directed RNA polymerase subunit beta [Chloroflexota bacterium]
MSQLTMSTLVNTLMPDQKTYARIPDVHSIPTLIKVQLESFEWFKTEGLRELFDEISPIESFNKDYSLYFPGDNDIARKLNLTYWFGEPKYSEAQCREMDMTFAAPMHLKVALINNLTGETTTQEVYMGDFALMTGHGTFVINGAERVVVSQLIRSPGVYFTAGEDRATGRVLCSAKLIPNRGAWLEFETSKRDILSVKVDRKRKLPVTMLLKAIGVGDGTDEGIINIFAGADNNSEHEYIRTTLERDPHPSDADLTKINRGEMTLIDFYLLEFYKKMRPGDPPTLDNARTFMSTLLFTQRRYDLGKVGRHKLNRRLYGTDIPAEQLPQERIQRADDLVKVIEHMILINNGVEHGDDIDHLGNRRVKTVGELIQNHLRIGLLRLERVVRERMSVRDPDQMTAINLINIRPVVAAMREFFGGSQLSQFMQQTNPLDELTHKRTLSALGPGGLRRERAGFDVRDVHHSHYGRICPIETPEGPNIGLIGRLATYAQINEFGFIETPYRIVKNEVPNDKKVLLGRILREDVVDPDSNKVIAKAETVVDETLAAKIAALKKLEEISVRAYATDEIVYLAADEEDRHTIAQANARLDHLHQFVDKRVEIRRRQQFLTDLSDRVQYLDVSPKQIVGVSAALIPFLEHDDANRALMGSNMQRQAVPLLRPEAPVVGTGMEMQAALDSGQVVVAEEEGEVVSVTAKDIKVRSGKKDRVYTLRKYNRSNQSTCIDQRPIAARGQKVKKGQVIADSSSTDEGQIALGQNVVVAFMSWEGGNYEDAILISERMAHQDKFSSIHVEKHEIEARDTKLGAEEITRDIPNVGEDVLKDLDEDGIIRIGAEVGPGDILVGKITPKGETDLTPEEKLLRAIFGEKAREVKDSSLRLPHGERGKVVDVKVFTRDEHFELPAGVDKLVRVAIAQQRKITEGDKMAGRHGNKGVISKVVPVQDMPYLEDGTPVDIILNPLGVPARMNIGQILETHLGWAADRLGFKVVSPVFDGADENEISAELARAWLIDRAWYEVTQRTWNWLKEQEYNLDDLTNDDEARALYLREWLPNADRRKLANDKVYARRQVLRAWLKEKGYTPDALLSFEDDKRTLDERVAADKLARMTCYRVWLETYDRKISEKASEEQSRAEVERVSQELKIPSPISGKMTLIDGKTGIPYDQPVTVGVIYMMKLAHLVEDKVHARSTGPYSLVTQQPLGGKAQFGGQRFGEMEVWALEAYGAAHTLQEMLTVKSDDVTGRVKTYESIVKGEEILEPGVPESFRVLVKELQSLGLGVEVYSGDGEKTSFGKEESEERMPSMGGGGLFHEGGPRSERDVMRERRERFARGERITGGGRRRGKRVEEREEKNEE